MPENINYHARGAVENPTGRFERLTLSDEHADPAPPDIGAEMESPPRLTTQIFRDTSRTIITRNDSPDVGMDTTVNPYRGCEHGCIYCYARPTHEYLGLSAGLDFESKIFVKEDAAKLLHEKLMSPRWEPRLVHFSGITDCYQPLERKLKITRACLEVLAEFRNPVGIITKNFLVTRDIDVLSELAAHNAVTVNLSITTLDPKLASLMEPRTAQPKMRLKAVEMLAKAGIPVGINIGPVLPGLTDHEIPAILEAAANAGARRAGYTMLRLPYAVKDLFQSWLAEHFPDRKDKVLAHVREVRGGKLNDAGFGTRMTGTGPYAEQVQQMFRLYRRRHGLDRPHFEASTAAFKRPAAHGQGSLF